MSFKEFPWFKDAVIAEIVNVEWPHPHHLYWPDLDVDIEVDSIRHPKRFPFVSKASRPARHSGRRKTVALI